MRIETKYNVNEKLWYMKCGEVFHGIIQWIQISVCNTHEEITYHFWDEAQRQEDELFKNKQELLDNLKNKKL